MFQSSVSSEPYIVLVLVISLTLKRLSELHEQYNRVTVWPFFEPLKKETERYRESLS